MTCIAFKRTADKRRNYMLGLRRPLFFYWNEVMNCRFFDILRRRITIRGFRLVKPLCVEWIWVPEAIFLLLKKKDTMLLDVIYFNTQNSVECLCWKQEKSQANHFSMVLEKVTGELPLVQLSLILPNNWLQWVKKAREILAQLVFEAVWAWPGG